MPPRQGAVLVSIRDRGKARPPRAVPKAVIPVALTGGSAVGIGEVIRHLGGTVSLPVAAWIPLSTAAVPAIMFGLWLGFRTHGRGEPLALGAFGLGVALAGLLVGYPVTVAGAAITLGAALWSTMVAVLEPSRR